MIFANFVYWEKKVAEGAAEGALCPFPKTDILGLETIHLDICYRYFFMNCHS